LPALSRLDGSLSGGVWGLRIVDDRFPDSDLEQLNSWGLELCGSTTMTHVVYLPLVRR
jgi:subtilisin-like proprotein convertase family protein